MWCWRIRLRVPWTARRSNQLILKENQPWIFIGRTDAEAEAPILWPPDVKSHRKDPDSGKDWRQKKWAEEDGITDSKHMNLFKLWEVEKDRCLLCGNPWEHRVRHYLVTEKQQHYRPCMCLATTTICSYSINMSISSVQFSRSVVSNSLQPHERQHTRPPCPSLTPGVYIKD